MNRNLHAALAGLLFICACSTEPVAPPTIAKLAPPPSLDVLTIASGPTHLSRGAFQNGILEDINNSGTQVGTLRSAAVSQAVKYVAGHPISLTPPAGTQSQAYGINDQGYVVGSFTNGATTQAVYWDPVGHVFALAGGGNVLTGAYDINENGLIVGFINSATHTTDRAGYWNLGGAFTQLALPPGAQGSQAYAVNDNGDIVGYSIFANAQDFRPTLWKAPLHTPTILPVPPGFFGGILRGITNSGMIVGSVVSSSCNPPCGVSLKPAFWPDEFSSPTVIAADWIARDINESGLVVGGNGVAFAWSQHTGVVTLPSTGSVGMAINDVGDVVGYNRPAGVQEPTQWSLRYERDDADGDGIADVDDNCPRDANADQSDVDGDGFGDACDPFPYDVLNDADGDGVGGERDNCAAVANPNQEDADGDGLGDFCDPFPLDPENDLDRDGIGGDVDNCPRDYNPGQADSDRDARGDVCDPNTPPTIVRLTLPAAPIAVGATANVTVDFTDPELGDTHSATVDWEGGTSTSSVVPTGARTFSATNSFSQAGVYTVVATVIDQSGAGDRRSSALELIAYIVVYDPNGGFVTGGGAFTSPVGACTLASCSSSTTGKASFGFVSKYQRGASVPTGNTEFHFKAGDLRFSSSSYEWLVVAGSRALYKGEGSINGGGRYGFMITAIDGKDDGGPDQFRIKIWDFATGIVVYDNQRGSADDSGEATPIESGSIVIHR